MKLNLQHSIARRLKRLREINDEPRLIPVEREMCRRSVSHWMANWCWTFDPRAAIGGLAFMPFDPYPRQMDWLAWMDERLAARDEGLVEKSRDVGFSWLSGGYALHKWLFAPGFKTTFGSRKEEYVDKSGDPDSLLEKIRMMFFQLPKWQWPRGFMAGKNFNYMRLINPENGNIIRGEAGDQMGRGGRAQPLDAKVLTPVGWRSMGDIQAGDHVIGANGQATLVRSIHPQGVKPVLRVTFNDGASTECCDDHLWQVTDRYCRKVLARGSTKTWGDRFHVKRLSELRQKLRTARTDKQLEYNYRIPMADAVHYAPVYLPLHPYVVGCLLGDGSVSQIHRTTVGITSNDPELIARFASLLPIGMEVRAKPDALYDYTIIDPNGRRGHGMRTSLKAALFDLGMAGKTALHKSIPVIYFRGTPMQRLELLRGLLDTDGWIGRRGSDPARQNSANKTCFATISPQLAADVVKLVQSLGGVARITHRKGARRMFPQGRAYDCQDSITVTINLPWGLVPFSLSRKRDLYTARTKYKPSRSMVSAEPVGSKECVCITVDADDGLYITDDFIVTHNSTLYFIDEAAFIERADRVNASTSANVDVRIWGSTVNSPGDLFARKRHKLPPEQVFIFDYRDNPLMTPERIRKKKAELEDFQWASEYERDYSASVEGICIPAKWVNAAKRLASLVRVEPTVSGVAGGDVGAGKAKSVWVPRWGPVVGAPVAWGEADTINTAYKLLHESRDVRTWRSDGTECRVNHLRYDSVGVGQGVVSVLARCNVPDLTSEGVNVGLPPTDLVWPDGESSVEKFANLKAESWWICRERFKHTYQHVRFLEGEEDGIEHELSDLISVPDDKAGPEASLMTMQLSLVKWQRNEKGKIAIESKESLKKRGVASPDHADALMLTFAGYGVLELWAQLA